MRPCCRRLMPVLQARNEGCYRPRRIPRLRYCQKQGEKEIHLSDKVLSDMEQPGAGSEADVRSERSCVSDSIIRAASSSHVTPNQRRVQGANREESERGRRDRLLPKHRILRVRASKRSTSATDADAHRRCSPHTARRRTAWLKVSNARRSHATRHLVESVACACMQPDHHCGWPAASGSTSERPAERLPLYRCSPRRFEFKSSYRLCCVTRLAFTCVQNDRGGKKTNGLVVVVIREQRRRTWHSG